MSLVYIVAMKSKDQNSHLGAVIVGSDHEIRSVGYNSYPRGLNDNLPERQERPEPVVVKRPERARCRLAEAEEPTGVEA